MIAHKTFLVILALDLMLFPLLALMDLGFSVGLESNYVARFFYISVILVAIAYIVFIKKKFIAHPLVVVFLMSCILGSLKGVLEGQVNAAYVTHLYYVIMPPIMLSYGWYFFKDYEDSHFLQRSLENVMYIAFYAGILAVLLFQVSSQLGMAKYDAIGLWNFVYSGPFLLYQQHGAAYFGLSFIATLLAGKRGVVAIYIVFLIILLIVSDRKSRLGLVSVLLVCAVIFAHQSDEVVGVLVGRVERTLLAIQDGDYDMAFARRWSESISAIEYLNNRLDHWLIGPGFGAMFLPWPNLPDYENYYSHYVHFSVISYIWLGGVFLSSFVYLFLFYLGISLVRKIRIGLLDKRYFYYAYWMWGVIVGSFSGADLMNSPYLWFIVGCCLCLNYKYTSCRKLGLASE